MQTTHSSRNTINLKMELSNLMACSHIYLPIFSLLLLAVFLTACGFIVMMGIVLGNNDL